MAFGGIPSSFCGCSYDFSTQCGEYRDLFLAHFFGQCDDDPVTFDGAYIMECSVKLSQYLMIILAYVLLGSCADIQKAEVVDHRSAQAPEKDEADANKKKPTPDPEPEPEPKPEPEPTPEIPPIEKHDCEISSPVTEDITLEENCNISIKEDLVITQGATLTVSKNSYIAIENGAKMILWIG